MDDKIVNGIDTQNALDDIEISIDKLIKKKRLWTGIAVLCFIVWLLILMYTIFWGTAHQDTIKPTEPPPTIANKPIKEPKQVNKTENIKVKEYQRKIGKRISVIKNTYFSEEFGSTVVNYLNRENRKLWGNVLSEINKKRAKIDAQGIDKKTFIGDYEQWLQKKHRRRT